MKKLVGCLGVVTLVGFFLAGSALAEEKESELLQTPGVLTEEQIAGMTPEAMLSFAGEESQKMQGLLQRTLDLLEKTRAEEKEFLVLNCINKKLGSMKGFVKIGDKAVVALSGAVDRKNAADQAHQLKLVSLASQSVQQLAEEAEQCTGQVTTYTGPTRLTSKTDPDVRTDNPTKVETKDVPIDELIEASPYQ